MGKLRELIKKINTKGVTGQLKNLSLNILRNTLTGDISGSFEKITDNEPVFQKINSNDQKLINFDYDLHNEKIENNSGLLKILFELREIKNIVSNFLIRSPKDREGLIKRFSFSISEKTKQIFDSINQKFERVINKKDELFARIIDRFRIKSNEELKQNVNNLEEISEKNTERIENAIEGLNNNIEENQKDRLTAKKFERILERFNKKVISPFIGIINKPKERKISDNENGIFEKLKDLLLELRNKSNNGIGNFLMGLFGGKILGFLKNVFTGFFKFVFKILNGKFLFDILKNVFSKNTLNTIKGFFEKLFEKLISFLSLGKEKIGNVLGRGLNKFKENINRTLNSIKEWISNRFDLIKELTNRGLKRIKEFGIHGLNVTKEWINHRLNLTKDLVSKEWKRIKELGTYSLNAAKKWISHRLNLIRELTSLGWIRIKELVTHGWNETKEWSVKNLNNIKEFAINISNITKQWINHGWTILKEWMFHGFNVIKEWTSNVIKHANDLFDSMKGKLNITLDWIKSKGTVLKERASQILETVKNWIKEKSELKNTTEKSDIKSIAEKETIEKIEKTAIENLGNKNTLEKLPTENSSITKKILERVFGEKTAEKIISRAPKAFVKAGERAAVTHTAALAGGVAAPALELGALVLDAYFLHDAIKDIINDDKKEELSKEQEQRQQLQQNNNLIQSNKQHYSNQLQNEQTPIEVKLVDDPNKIGEEIGESFVDKLSDFFRNKMFNVPQIGSSVQASASILPGSGIFGRLYNTGTILNTIKNWIFPDYKISSSNVKQYVPYFVNELKKHGIVSNSTEASMILAQSAQETGGFKYMSEIPYTRWTQVYAARGAEIARITGKSDAEVRMMLQEANNNPIKLMDYMYGDAYRGRGFKLGNTNPGDGYKYRGRGFVHLTGKSLYAEATRYLQSLDDPYLKRVNLIENPDLMATDPKVNAAVSIWYLKRRGIKSGNYTFNDLTRKINGAVGNALVAENNKRATWYKTIAKDNTVQELIAQGLGGKVISPPENIDFISNSSSIENAQQENDYQFQFLKDNDDSSNKYGNLFYNIPVKKIEDSRIEKLSKTSSVTFDEGYHTLIKKVNLPTTTPSIFIKEGSFRYRRFDPDKKFDVFNKELDFNIGKFNTGEKFNIFNNELNFDPNSYYKFSTGRKFDIFNNELNFIPGIKTNQGYSILNSLGLGGIFNIINDVGKSFDQAHFLLQNIDGLISVFGGKSTLSESFGKIKEKFIEGKNAIERPIEQINSILYNVDSIFRNVTGQSILNNKEKDTSFSFSSEKSQFIQSLEPSKESETSNFVAQERNVSRKLEAIETSSPLTSSLEEETLENAAKSNIIVVPQIENESRKTQLQPTPQTLASVPSIPIISRNTESTLQNIIRSQLSYGVT